jgi:signal transduction histidine kinase
MSSPRASLARKFALGTAAGLLASSLVFLVLFVGLFRNQLQQQRADAAGQVSRLLQISLENAMLRHDLDGLRGIVERLGRQPDVLSVTIANPQGEVRFANDPARLGQRLPPESDDQPATRLIEAQAGPTVLRSVNPVPNQPPCQECHGPMAERPINGVLYVDYDADSIGQQARHTTLLLMGAGSLIVLLNLAGGWWFMRRYVLRPIAHLAAASARISEGDLASRTHLEGGDELTDLGEAMNRMAAALQRQVAELQEKGQFLQALLDAFPDGVRVIDQDYRVLLSNAAYRRLIGPAGPATPLNPHPDARPCYAQTHGQDQPCPETLMACPLHETSRTGAPLRLVHHLKRADGAGLDVETYAAPLTLTQGGQARHLVVESIRDLGQAVRFSHEQRLSELGRLAAGVAHEIYNPLGSVRLALHAAETAARATEPDLVAVRTCLELVDQEVETCIQVTQRLLRLSVTPPDHPELVEATEAVDDTLRLLTWEAMEQGVTIRQDCAESLRVMATDTELRMAILNLAQNALHAMAQGGTLDVSCARRDGQVEIAFTDNGVGIPRQDLWRIFQPFFSRRADGVHGTGLGLSITKAFVEHHGGRITVVSEPGRGSRFTLILPDADLEPDGAPPHVPPPRPET